MTDSNDFGYQDGGMAPGAGSPMPGSRQLATPYKFTPEELRVLAECNSESFYQRCLPLGTFLGLGTYAAMQRGILRPNARFGVYPKVTIAVIVGYFVGKLSYQQACAEKLMALPDSELGRILRQKSKMGTRPTMNSPPMLGAKPDDIYSDAGPGSSLDLDTDRPVFSGDDTYHPSSREVQDPVEVAPRSSLSYEELRKKNRGDYSQQRQDPYRVDPNSVPPVTRAPPPPTTSGPRRNVNQYGDEMD